MAHYSGCFSAATLFDSLEAQVPTHSEMRQAAMLDDCASARLFMRNVDAFISHVLGVDPDTKQPRTEDGLFGKRKAYFGMVETQGRGTLHIHFLVWIFNVPRNATEFKDKLCTEGQHFKDRIAVYVDSIVTNELPLPLEQSKCANCGAQQMIQPLPLLPSARQRDRRRAAQRCDKLEPLLIECGVCGQRCSAQH